MFKVEILTFSDEHPGKVIRENGLDCPCMQFCAHGRWSPTNLIILGIRPQDHPPGLPKSLPVNFTDDDLSFVHPLTLI